MPQRQLVGSRIRARRIERGIKQADLAKTVSISASYLNLIEHNRRRVAGKLLSDIAQALDVGVSQLSDRVDAVLIEQLKTLVAIPNGIEAEIAGIEDFVCKFPGWANLLLSLQHQIEHAEGRVTKLLDRMLHDPQLATSLHEVISMATSIRSTASILSNDDHLDGDWLRRFHSNIHEDSLRMAEASRKLVTYLETPDTETPVISPQEELDSWLDASRHVFPDLETQEDFQPARLRSPEAARMFSDFAGEYRADALSLPMEQFAPAAISVGYDPLALSQKFEVAIDLVFRRLAALPLDQGHPEFGLLTCDAAGAILRFKPIDGFVLKRTAAICPLWPIFSALSHPNVPIRHNVALPGNPEKRFLCYAIAMPIGQIGYSQPPRQLATMIVRPVSDATKKTTPVGPTCRICVRDSCMARRESSIFG